MAMENSKVRNMYSGSGRQYPLPPKSPFPSITCPFYAAAAADYTTPNKYSQTRSKGIIPKYRDGNSFHQRTSSESLVIEEQPSWLDELLDEPETPLRRGHRRSSSDSFTYNINMEQNLTSAPSPSWGSQDFDIYEDARNTSSSFYGDKNPVIINNNNRVWDTLPHATSLGPSQEVNTTTTQKQETLEPFVQASETNDSPNTNASASETDTKRSKQQFAQRSRVRKLQYIAELERNVQVLQAEGSEVSSELKFLNQQSLILTMENKALKQRLENLAQEQLIKYLEHEVLEREIGRLRALYKQQQQPQAEKPHFSHQRTTNMESQFANISLKNKESVAIGDGPLRI